MSTRGYIGRLNPDGTVTFVYSHANNYLSANGWLLATHYTDPAKVDALLALEAICEVGVDIGEPHEYRSERPRIDGWRDWCLSFYRDRGETEVRAQTVPAGDWATHLDMDIEGAFLFADGAWHYAQVKRIWGVYRFIDWRRISIVDGVVVTTPSDPLPPSQPAPVPPPPYRPDGPSGMVSITVVPREVTEQLLQAERDRLPNW